MKLLLIAAVISLSLSAAAQNKFLFSSQNYVGLTEGEHGSKWQLQTINGFKYKTWFAGIGTGLDWYYQKSIPVFVDITKDIFPNGNRNFFISADGGINFPWEDERASYPGYGEAKMLNGLYWGTGIGYKIGIGKRNDAILLQVGYSYKYSGEKSKPMYILYTPFISSPMELYDRNDYHLRRLSLKIGWKF
ncbi:MAG TPA: hypothetical protein VGI82_09250 [Chitinophagaceae bacterium]|jgi:hypothetical protein